MEVSKGAAINVVGLHISKVELGVATLLAKEAHLPRLAIRVERNMVNGDAYNRFTRLLTRISFPNSLHLLYESEIF